MSDEKRVIIDSIGNELKPGDLVHMIPPNDQLWIGKVTESIAGYIEKSSLTGKTNVVTGKLRMVFDVTLALNPQENRVRFLVKIVNPMDVAKVEKAMEELDKLPPPTPIRQ